jgi:cytochrome c-type biogenesis protein CcmH
MHKDVVALVDGGYSADEILAAFEQVYGEEVLMAPKKAGFNWAGYIAPFAVIGGGGVALAALMRRWSRRAAAVAAAERAGARRPRVGQRSRCARPDGRRHARRALAARGGRARRRRPLRRRGR